MAGVDHARVVSGMADSILAVLPDAAGPIKLVQRMSALCHHAYIHVAAVVHCVFSAVVGTHRVCNRGVLCSHTLQVDHLCEQVKQDVYQQHHIALQLCPVHNVVITSATTLITLG